MRLSKNTILLIVFVTLLGGFVLSRIFRTPSLETNLEEHLLTLDTSEINAIHIRPMMEKGEIKLVRTGNSWQVEHDENTANVEIAEVKNALETIREVHPERLVTRKKEKWADYNVDTTGTHVKVFLGQDTHTEFWVGKTSSGGNCIRIEGDDDVYEVEEMLDRNFNKNFNAWRDKTFLKVQPDSISKIAFEYPGDSSFVVEQSSGKWVMDNVLVDSSKVQTYLNRFRSRNLSEFADNFTPPDQPSYILKLSKDASTVITVQGWKMPDDKWILTSSLQASVYFSSGDASMIRDLFTGKKWFFSK